MRAAPPIATVAQVTPAGIHKIQHVVMIVQENRSFDSYFGTYPGADGIPARDGKFTVCLPDPARGTCDPPFHDSSLVNGGGPHGLGAAEDDIDGGRMDGFVRESESRGGRGCGGFAGVCNSSSPSDVMGYHDAREIPNYWKYAENFTLDDHMFESNRSWSLPAHLFEVSLWSARCSRQGDPSSCVNDDELGGYQTQQIIGVGTIGRRAADRMGRFNRVARWRLRVCDLLAGASTGVGNSDTPRGATAHAARARCRRQVQARLAQERAMLVRQVSTIYNYGWTDITYLLYKHGVSWGYFITPGGEPDCEGGNANCASAPLSVGTPDIWNPLPSFTDVQQDEQVGNIQDTSRFLADAQTGTMPAVSWVVPDQPHSDHPPANIATGQAYVTNLINTVMRGPDWGSTAIFLIWDDWGGSTTT